MENVDTLTDPTCDQIKDIPVIALTTAAMPGDIKWGAGAGFADCLRKPIEIDKMVAVIGSILQKCS